VHTEQTQLLLAVSFRANHVIGKGKVLGSLSTKWSSPLHSHSMQMHI
jgi:hypothetical protein